MIFAAGSTWKRKHARVNLEMKGDYCILQPDRDKERHLSRIRTLGGGGLMIVSSDPLSVGTPLQMRLFHHQNIITVNSKVVWTAPPDTSDPSNYRIGLKFDPPSQSSLLYVDFLLQNCKNH